MSKVIKRTIVMLLVICLIYANLSTTIFGIISYAEDNNQTVEEDTNKVNESEEKPQEEVKNRTIAELGIDKETVSTTQESTVNFTIIMRTDKQEYEVYKNPYFEIELPEEIEYIKELLEEDIKILNSSELKLETVAVEGKKIKIQLSGEQTKRTESKEDNIYISLKATIKASELTPSKDSKIKMNYKNEKATAYEIENKDKTMGETFVNINIQAKNGIIVGTKVQAGEEIKEEINKDIQINIRPSKQKTATITATVINNTESILDNAYIKGTLSTEITEELNVTISPEAEHEILYSVDGENWTTEISKAKYYKINIKNFIQGQKIVFSYNINMPEIVEIDTTYTDKYIVCNNENTELKVAQITVIKETESYENYEDEKIKANIVVESESEKIQVGSILTGTINIQNISEQDIEEATIDIKIPENLTNNFVAIHTNGEIVSRYIFVDAEKINLTGINLPKSSNTTIDIEIVVDKYIQPIENLEATLKYADKEIKLLAKMDITEPSNIETSITSNKLDEELEVEEEIEYKITLKNAGESNSYVDVALSDMKSLNIINATVNNLATGETYDKTLTAREGYISNINIKPEEVVEIIIECVVSEVEKDTINIMYAELTGITIKETTTAKLLNNIIGTQEDPEEEEPEQEAPNEDKPDEDKPNEDKPNEDKPSEDKPNEDKPNEDKPNGDKPNEDKPNEENPEEQEAKKGSVKGIAWVDINENGKRDKDEIVLKDIEVILIDAQTSKVIETKSTDNNGEYQFKDVIIGKYVVQFNYNTTKFALTDYKKEGVNEEENSDAINYTQDNKTYSKTEVIDLKEGKTEQRDIGLRLNQIFDMGIEKGISKVTVTNKNENTTYNFNNTSMAKIEVKDKYLKDSMILVEYDIAVTNSGEIAGYVKTISDKIPEGMIFNSELNTNWYKGNDGMLYCSELINKELKPGETTSVKLVLTKQIETDTVTNLVNRVEIVETFNEYIIKDKEKENNTSSATLIISIKTGGGQSYIWLIMVVLTILTTGTLGVMRITKNNGIKVVTNKERRK